MGESNATERGDLLGALVLVFGIAALWIGVRALGSVEASIYSPAIGAASNVPRKFPTHDYMIRFLGHGLLPWSAVIPVALAQLLGAHGASDRGESGVRLTVAVVCITGVGVHALMAPTVQLLPFAAVAGVAAAIALALRDYERAGGIPRPVAIVVAALAFVFYFDFKSFPDRGFSAYAIDGVAFPESYKQVATRWVKYGTFASTGLFVLLAFDTDGRRVGSASGDFRRYLSGLKRVFSGNLFFGLLVTEAGADRVVCAHLAESEASAHPSTRLPQRGGSAGCQSWVLGAAAARVGRSARGARRSRRHSMGVFEDSRARAAAAGLAIAAFGLVMSLGYYPALAAQLSPKEAFDSYQRMAAEGEPLGVVGENTGAATYYARRQVENFANVTSAFTWMMAAPAQRRWLVVKAADLPRLNSLHRKRVRPHANLPVLDARSSEILLVSNQLGNGTQQNPFADWILDTRPTPQHPVDAMFSDQLLHLGWSVTTLDGRFASSVTPGKRYQFKLYYEVKKPISGKWRTFVHIDGFQRRYNGDHDTLEDKYPLHLLKPGDFVCDVHEFTLEPNFTPGRYNVFYGLFIGSRRLEVKRGKHNQNRLQGGPINVH